MSTFEVTEPILNSPFEEPKQHWWILEGEGPEKREGRRFAHYFYSYAVAKQVSEVPKILTASVGA